MSSALDSLLERRVLLVTGKGGTGKTSIAAALARLAARRGLETAVVEVGRDDALPPLLGAGTNDAREPGRMPFAVSPHLYTMRISPEVAFEEYVELQLHVGALARLLVRNAGFRRFLDAAPGWRELITLGKVWHLQKLARSKEGGGSLFDLVIVDAPATGHGLSLFSVPQVILDTVRMGPLRRHTEAVHDLLMDERRTLVLPVAIPEELPVRETIELCTRVRELGMHVGPAIANAVEPLPAGADAAQLLDAARALGPEDEAPALAEPKALTAAVHHRVRRAQLHAEFLEKLAAALGGRPIEVPFLVEGVQGPDDVDRLTSAIERGLEQREALP